MMRWALFVLTIVINLFWLALSQSAGFVSWAETAPRELTCSACSQPEVQSALIQAVSIGRQQVIHSLPDIWLISGLAIFNILLIALLLFNPGNVSRKR